MWTFITPLICCLKISIALSQTVTNDNLTTPTAQENDAPTSVPSAPAFTTNGENGATDFALSTRGVDSTSTTTPYSNGKGNGATVSKSTTSLDSGATDIALPSSGVDGTSTDTPHTNNEGNGATKTAPNETRADGANASVNGADEGSSFDVVTSSDVTVPTDLWEFNSGGSEWLWKSLSWKWDIILQLLSAIIGILGNLLVIVVIFSRRSSGRTTDILVGSLAVADFVTSFAIIPYPTPIRVPNTWQGMSWCLIMYQNLPLWLPVTASSYILMAISVERYIAVVYPLRFSCIVTVRRVNVAVGFIWFLALLSLLFGFFVTGVDKTYGFCTLTVTTRHGLAAMGYYWFCLRIVVPVATMLITQSLIALELHRQSKNFRGDSSSTNSSFHIVARNRVLKIMLEIIIIYIVCWLPNQVAFLGVIVGFIEWGKYIESPLHRVLTVIGFYNSCLNPFIYSAQHPQFRNAVKGLFRGETNKNSSVFGGHKPDSSDKKRYTSKDTSSI